MHVTFNESNPFFVVKVVINDDVDKELQEESSKDKQEDALHENQKDRHEDEINMEQQEGISQIEPKSFADVENDESWIMAM